MSRQYIREAELTIGNLVTATVITGLRIQFMITKDLQGFPNLAEISIFNLNEDTRSKIQNEFENLVLKAGYKDNLKTIFTGDLRNVTKTRIGPDLITTIFAADGNKDFNEAFYNKSFNDGSKVTDIITDIVSEFEEVTKGVIEGVNTAAQKVFGATFSGNSSEVLDQLGDENEFDWSIQNGKVDIIARDSYVDEQTVITSRTGMINSPTITEIGIDVKTLLNPSILPGRLIKVESSAPNFSLGNLNFREINKTLGEGVYKVIKIIHNGDTHSNNWDSTITGSQI